MLAAGVALLTFLVYCPALLNGFVNWDDDLYVYGNPNILSLKPPFFVWAFTDLSAGFWHPLTWISFAVDYAVWGLNPLGYHLTAIFLHALNTALVVVVTSALLDAAQRWKVTSIFPDKRNAWVVAGITGLLFGLHPLHVESVAWVSERKDLLCAFFFLLSLSAYLKDAVLTMGRQERRPCPGFPWSRWRLLAFLFFICALSAKTMAVTLPVVLMILDWYPLGRIRTAGDSVAMLLEKIPFVLGSLAIAVISIIAQKSIGALVLMDSKPFATRLLVACKAVATYLWKMLIPVDLLPFYPYPQQVSLLSAEYLLSVIVVVGITAGCIFAAGKRKVLTASWLYFLATLLPVLGFVQVGVYAMADRFTYLPSLGPFLLMGLGAAMIRERLAVRRSVERGAIVVAVVLIVVMSHATVKQIAVWKSSIGLWNYVIEKEPRRILYAYLNRGVAFGDNKEFGRAIEDFTTAISMDPKSGNAYLNRGMALVAQGEFERAIMDYDMALALNPSFVDAYSNRGGVWYRKGELDRAIDDYNRALSLQPDSLPALINRAIAFKKKGATDRAIEDYSHVISLNPDAKFFIGRGDLYMKKGDVERAVKDYRKACDQGSREGCRKAFFPVQALFPQQ